MSTPKNHALAPTPPPPATPPDAASAYGKVRLPSNRECSFVRHYPPPLADGLIAHLHLPCRYALNADAEALAPFVGYFADRCPIITRFPVGDRWGDDASFHAERFIGAVGYVSVFTRLHYFAVTSELPKGLSEHEQRFLYRAALPVLETAFEDLRRSLFVGFDKLSFSATAPVPSAVLAVPVPVHVLFSQLSPAKEIMPFSVSIAKGKTGKAKK
jgi:hypothetical protein